MKVSIDNQPKMKKQSFIYAAFAAAVTVAAAACPLSSSAQSQAEPAATGISQPIVIEPLFEYPVAPDSLPTMQDKSDWLVDHFWDTVDFSKKTTVDQNALNAAFKVYLTPVRFADGTRAMASIDRLIKNISKNPALTYQFAKAAEENLYGQRADFWNDDIYLKFVDALMANKKIKKERKVRYADQKRRIENSRLGQVPSGFDYTLPTGATARFEPNGVITVIEFGDPDCDDCQIAKLKMETDVKFSSLVDRGLVNVLFVIPDPETGWEVKLAEYSPKWHVGASDTVSDLLDIRTSPSLYVVGKDGKLLAKNVDITTAIPVAVNAATETDLNQNMQ